MSNQKTQKANNLNPINIFHVWYNELCRRANISPSPTIKSTNKRCQTTLDFLADRLKIDEWKPIYKALGNDKSLHVIKIKSRMKKCQFLYEIDTEEKLYTTKRRYGSILWTDFIMKSLLKSLSRMLETTQVLTYLEFEGLPLFGQYLEILIKALQKNKTLKILSLKRCSIKDDGCQIVCNYIKSSPNIEVLNLSNCGLTSKSGEYLAKLIKYQQIIRYSEAWQNSLRYSEANFHSLSGLKRISLNKNRYLGNEGLELILNELFDDLWIKAVDLQNCGITDEISAKILEVVDHNESLEILDLQRNKLNNTIIEKILNILKNKQDNEKLELQWCNTSTTLSLFPLSDTNNTTPNFSTTTLQNKNQVMLQHKTKSSTTTLQHKNQVLPHKTKSTPTKSVPVKTNKELQQEINRLQSQLRDEMNRRMELERANHELTNRLDSIMKVARIQVNNHFIPLINLTDKSTLQNDNKSITMTHKNSCKEPTTVLKNPDDSDESDIDSSLTYLKNDTEVNSNDGVLV